MKAIAALVLVLVAIASAQNFAGEEAAALMQESQALQAESAYVNGVEYVDTLDTPPNPELVPKHFVEAFTTKRKGGKKALKKGAKKAMKKARKAARKGNKKTAKKVNKKIAKKAAKKHAKKLAKKLHKKINKANGNLAKLTKLAMSLSKKHAKLTLKSKKKGKAGIKAKADLKAVAKELKAVQIRIKALTKKGGKASKKGAKKAVKLAKKAAKAAKKATKKAAKKALKNQKKADKRAKKTDKRVKTAMNKLQHLTTSMGALQRLMNRINGQVTELLPENRIRKYEMEDPSKISNSQMGNLTQPSKDLVNGYAKKQNNEASYSNAVIPKNTKVIRKADDMAVQDISSSAKELSKFTKKLAAKDTVSLV